MRGLIEEEIKIGSQIGWKHTILKTKPNCKKRPNTRFKSGLAEGLIERKYKQKDQIVLNWKYTKPMIKTKIVPKLKE